jgi:hypothetical protein
MKILILLILDTCNSVIDKFHFLIFQQATTVHPVVDVSNTDSTGNVMQCVLYSRSAIFSVAGMF